MSRDKPKMRWVILCRVGQPAKLEEFDMRYQSVRDFVGGLVENARVAPGIEVVCNEEGIIIGLPFNRALPAPVGVHHLYGDFIVCGNRWSHLHPKHQAALLKLLNDQT